MYIPARAALVHHPQAYSTVQWLLSGAGKGKQTQSYKSVCPCLPYSTAIISLSRPKTSPCRLPSSCTWTVLEIRPPRPLFTALWFLVVPQCRHAASCAPVATILAAVYAMFHLPCHPLISAWLMVLVYCHANPAVQRGARHLHLDPACSTLCTYVWHAMFGMQYTHSS